MRAVGVGLRPGTPAAEVEAALADIDADILATVDVRADEPGIVAVAHRRGWSVVSYPASELAAVTVPNPSTVVRSATGTPSVAEAAALLAAGPNAALLMSKRASGSVTVALARADDDIDRQV